MPTKYESEFIAEGLKGKAIFLSAYPGSGKGTACQHLLATVPGLVHLSTGELFRAEAATGSELGKKFDKYMQEGVAIPHELVAEYLTAELSKPKYRNGLLLDGFPKNDISYHFIVDVLPKKQIEPFLAIHLDCTRETCKKRLSGRLHCPNCNTDFHVEFRKPKVEGKCDGCGHAVEPRADDKPEAIEKRLNVFEKETMPNVERFRASGILCRVDAEKSVDEVRAQVLAALLGRVKDSYAKVITQGLLHRAVIFAGNISCGKGTQTAALRTLTGDQAVHLSTGNLFRAEVASGSEIGKAFDKHMKAGELIPQPLIDSYLTAEFAKPQYKQGLLLDGYPREEPALDFISAVLPKQQIEPFLAIHIDVARDVIHKRLCGRRSCNNKDCGATFHVEFKKPKVEDKCDKCGGALVQRDDDKPEAIDKRMGTFDQKTMPMLQKFQAQGGVVVKVDGSAAIGDVTLQVFSAVRNRILAQRENNFYLRPTLEEPRSPTFHGHIDAHSMHALCDLVNEIEAANKNFQHKVYPIAYLALCAQTKDAKYGPVYQCLPNFHVIKDRHDEGFATSRHGDKGFDYELIQRTLEVCWGPKWCKDANGVMTELEEEVFVGEFEGHAADGKIIVETDSMKTAGEQKAKFDWKRLGEKWRKRQVSHVPAWELHLAVNIAKTASDGTEPPIPLEAIRAWADGPGGCQWGGCFIFRKDTQWAYRTNEFSDAPTIEEAYARLIKQARALTQWVRDEQAKPGCTWKDREISTGFSIEIVHAIWHVDEKLKAETEDKPAVLAAAAAACSSCSTTTYALIGAAIAAVAAGAWYYLKNKKQQH